jgi:hypothetical protein
VLFYLLTFEIWMILPRAEEFEFDFFLNFFLNFKQKWQK